MSYRFVCEIGGWGAIQSPLDEDEYLTIENDKLVVEDEELAEAVDREFPQLRLVEEPDGESAENDDAFDAESFLDRTPMTSVVEDIKSGEADEHLDALAEQADRQGVQDAIADRQDEL